MAGSFRLNDPSEMVYHSTDERDFCEGMNMAKTETTVRNKSSFEDTVLSSGILLWAETA
jgi:hypothetical protein